MLAGPGIPAAGTSPQPPRSACGFKPAAVTARLRYERARLAPAGWSRRLSPLRLPESGETPREGKKKNKPKPIMRKSFLRTTGTAGSKGGGMPGGDPAPGASPQNRGAGAALPTRVGINPGRGQTPRTPESVAVCGGGTQLAAAHLAHRGG